MGTRTRPAAVFGRLGTAVLAAAVFGGMLMAPAAAAAAPSAPDTSDATATATALPPDQGASTVPAAKLTEINVPGTKPMSTSAVDLAKYGYTEREYYSEGVANRYRGATAAATQNATVIDGNNPYKTRVLVRTPKPKDFNGTVIVEWTNVTIGLDADFVFAEAHDDYLRQGYAYAVVSAQKVGVDQLKTWSPERYGSLSVDANNIDPNGGNVDACRNGATTCAGDPLSWDVFAQTAAALKANTGQGAPLAGLKVRDVIATGQSQSASRLTSYYNAIQPLHKLFNGFVFWDRATAKLRPEVAVPGISVNSEGLSNLYQPFGTSTYTREWEVAGSTHGSTIAQNYVDTMFNRDASLLNSAGQPISFTQWIEPSCTVLPAFSPVPNGYVVAAATDAVKKWIEKGKAAPPSIYYQRDANNAVVRDAKGNIKGGIRLAEFAVPTAEIKAFNGTAFPCSVSGSHRDYSAQELKTLYRNHGTYVAKVAATTYCLADRGYLLRYDAVSTVREAAASNVGR